MTIETIEQAKARAKYLRATAADRGETLSHGRALEMVAQEQGARDWNTLRARLARSQTTAMPLDILRLRPGMEVEGRYMNQPFTGRMVNAAPEGDGVRVAIQLDHPVDTVTFASFSNMRRRVQGVIGKTGCTVERNSNGVPHLVLTAIREAG